MQSLHLASLLILTTLPLGTAAQAQAWKNLNPASKPMARSFHAMAYDSVRDRVVLFGGHKGGTARSPLGDTWEFDGAAWIQMKPALVPPARVAAQLCYDPTRRVCVLYGGSGLKKDLADTWEWDGKAWTQILPKSTPGPLSNQGMCFDEEAGAILVFGGGTVPSKYSNRLWKYDGRNWTHIQTTIAPPARAEFSMCFDPVRRRTLIQGGLVWSGSKRVYLKPDTWAFDSRSNAWSKLSLKTNVSARGQHAMIQAGPRSPIVLFGGFTGHPVLKNHSDLWRLGSSIWTQYPQSGSWPSAREGHAMVYDSLRNRVILFGGQEGYGRNMSNETWELKVPVESPTLTAMPLRISASRGGTQSFELDGGKVNAKRLYLMLGTGSGTDNPWPLFGVKIPINFDFYTLFLLGSPGMPIQNMIGTLNAQGKANAAWSIPAGTFPGLKGRTFHHAYVVFHSSGLFPTGASNAQPVVLIK